MRQDRSTDARTALEGLTARETSEVLGILCSHRPEAVLDAVQRLRSHQETVAQLLSRREDGRTNDPRAGHEAAGLPPAGRARARLEDLHEQIPGQQMLD